MGKKTTIYLSMEGVLLAPDKEAIAREWDTADTVTIEEIDGENTFSYSPGVIALINALSARDDIDIRWLTNWRKSAPMIVAPLLGLRGTDWPVVEDAEFTGSKKFSKSNADYWWKLDAFKKNIFDHPYRRLIWIDTNVEDNANDIDNWLDPSGVDEDNRLYIAPDENIGLTPAHIDSILEFISV